MKVVITTYPKYKYLLENGEKLLKKFWGREYTIDCAREGEKLTEQLLRIVQSTTDEYLILLKDDFYLIQDVDDRRVKVCGQYAVTHNIDRFSLQCRADGYEECSELYDSVLGERFYKLKDNAEYLCSLEASIWKTRSLKTLLDSGVVQYGSDRDVECNLSRNVRSLRFKVLVPERPFLVYKDAKIGGEDRIKFIDGELWHLTPDGWVNKHITV